MTPIDKYSIYYILERQSGQIVQIFNFYDCKDLVNLSLYPNGLSKGGFLFVESMIDANLLVDDILSSALVNVHMFEYII